MLGVRSAVRLVQPTKTVVNSFRTTVVSSPPMYKVTALDYVMMTATAAGGVLGFPAWVFYHLDHYKGLKKMLTATDENVILASAYEEGNNRRLDDLVRLLKIQSPVQKMDSRRYYIRPSGRLGYCMTARPREDGRLQLVVTSSWTSPATEQSETGLKPLNAQQDTNLCLAFMFESPTTEEGNGYTLTTVYKRQRYSLALPAPQHPLASMTPINSSGAANAGAIKCVTLSDGDTLLLHWRAWRPMFLSLKSTPPHSHLVPKHTSAASGSNESSYDAANSNSTAQNSSSMSNFPSLSAKYPTHSEAGNIHTSAQGIRSERENVNFAVQNSGLDDRKFSTETENTNPIVEKVFRSAFLIPRNVRSDLAEDKASIKNNWLDEELMVVFSPQYTGLLSQWILEKVP
ncbi:Cytochrome c oxidase subunit 8 [Trinorchestia longiramus]|nr:Cytochrome c oxidase subunit 8 [Trinorchestia longiramus]